MGANRKWSKKYTFQATELVQLVVNRRSRSSGSVSKGSFAGPLERSVSAVDAVDDGFQSTDLPGFVYPGNGKTYDEDHIYSVSSLTMDIKRKLREGYRYSDILLKGEVSNCKYHSAGHIYYSLKDADDLISCVMFRSDVSRGLDFRLEDGMEIIAAGYVDVYGPSGKYEFYTKNIIQSGEGLKQAELRKLYEKLSKEGLFDEDRKKPVPAYIGKLGVITSRTGAAVEDIVKTIRHKNPHIDIVIYNAIMQGSSSPASIIRGMEYFEDTDIETLIIGRGGGSQEDRWYYNDELLVRKIAAYTKPVITAIGHTPDICLADMAADLAAKVPADAADKAAYDYEVFEAEMLAREDMLSRLMDTRLSDMYREVRRQMNMLKLLSPVNILDNKKRSLDDKTVRLDMLMNSMLEKAKYRLKDTEKLDILMQQKIHESKQRLTAVNDLNAVMEKDLLTCKNGMAVRVSKLEGLSPLSRLKGGYAYVEGKDGNGISSVDDINIGDSLKICLQDGWVRAEASGIHKNDAGQGR